jgi:hypothetical protein
MEFEAWEAQVGRWWMTVGGIRFSVFRFLFSEKKLGGKLEITKRIFYIVPEGW